VIPEPKNIPSPTRLIIPKSDIVEENLQEFSKVFDENRGLTIFSVTHLKPTIPNINNVNNVNNDNNVNNELGQRGKIEKIEKIEFPQINTIIQPNHFRPTMSDNFDKEVTVAKIANINDEIREVLASIDWTLFVKRAGSKNKGYDLPHLKNLAKRLKVSPAGNKDVVMETIKKKGREYGFPVEVL
jgi:hypothetical protein